jgi:hypothetical protein
MNVAVRSRGELPHVLAELNYLGSMSERARNYATEPSAGVPQSNAMRDIRTVHLRRPFVGNSPVAADQAVRAKRRILVAASLATSLIMLDSNIVAVSLPSIARTLGAGFADIEWVISAYVLSFAALLLAAGSYADRHGRKRTTLIGLVVFAVASGLYGLAQSAQMLDLAQALQGVGASLLLTAALAIINRRYGAGGTASERLANRQCGLRRWLRCGGAAGGDGCRGDGAVHGASATARRDVAGPGWRHSPPGEHGQTDCVPYAAPQRITA